MRICVFAIVTVTLLLYGCSKDTPETTREAMQEAAEEARKTALESNKPIDERLDSTPAANDAGHSSTSSRADNQTDELSSLHRMLALCEQGKAPLQITNSISTMERLLWIALTIISVLVTILVQSKRNSTSRG